ncbi:MAG: MlaD family protein [Acidobacteriia bacterium]|nr:MlaD family protein [Terriglobia bacterium]
MPSARRVNWAKFRVTVVCLVALLILFTLVYLLTGGTLFQQKATVYMYIPDATGLAQDSPVRVDGIGVGKVKSVSLTGSREPNRVVKVTISVQRDRLASIPDDSFAQLGTDSLIGDKYVDITSGRNPNHIAPNGEITYKAQTDLMKSLDLSQFQQQLRIVDATLTEIEQGRSRVGQFVLGEEMYTSLLKYFSELQSGIRAAADVNSSLGRALYSDELYRQISDPIAEFDRSLARIQSGQGTAGSLFRDTAQYAQLRAGAHDLLSSLASLRSQEFMRSDRLYVDWNRAAISLIDSVDQMNASPLLNTSAAYDNLNGFAREWRDTVRDFREHPAKFLRLKVF